MSELRDRVLDATYAEVAENGLRGLTVGPVATRAGTSRATVYRHFPGGRDELVDTTIRREVERFYALLLADVGPTTDIEDHVGRLVIAARRRLGQHEVLQQLLEAESEAIVPSLATVQPLVHEGLRSHLGQVFAAGSLAPGVDADQAADHCARMILSYVGTDGAWDLDDPDAVAQVVRTRILSGVV